jgi:hypothetical protein
VERVELSGKIAGQSLAPVGGVFGIGALNIIRYVSTCSWST